MRRPEFSSLQRQNSLGIAFPGLVEHVLARFGNPHITYDTEVDAGNIFPGVIIPGRSTTPRIDLLARRNGVPVAIISAKWSLRHDRLSDIIQECPVYKEVAFRIHRWRVKYFVVTNEFDPSRLGKLVSDPCLDGLVHVHKPAVTHVCQLDLRLERMMDLSQLFQVTHNW